MRSRAQLVLRPGRSVGLWCVLALLLLLAAGGPPRRGALSLSLSLPASHRLADDPIVVAATPLRSVRLCCGGSLPCAADQAARVLPRWRSIGSGGLPAPRAPDA